MPPREIDDTELCFHGKLLNCFRCPRRHYLHLFPHLWCLQLCPTFRLVSSQDKLDRSRVASPFDGYVHTLSAIQVTILWTTSRQGWGGSKIRSQLINWSKMRQIWGCNNSAYQCTVTLWDNVLFYCRGKIDQGCPWWHFVSTDTEEYIKQVHISM